MKVIQSFAEFDEGSPYLKDDGSSKYLNFYSFFLSFITLKKYCGGVTMYCNNKAYNSFIKYIPYSETILFENKNTFRFWSSYKIDVMGLMKEKFVNVDTDVFIFDDVFKEFKTDNYDVVIQNRFLAEQNPDISSFVSHNIEFIKKNNIIDPNIYDGCSLNCGVVGMKLEIRDEYLELSNKIKFGYESNQISCKATTNEPYVVSSSLEELPLYFLILKKNLNILEILPQDMINSIGIHATANKMKYTHLWNNTKFNTKYIKAIKVKILEEFPGAKEYIDKYEKDVMGKTNILNEIL